MYELTKVQNIIKLTKEAIDLTFKLNGKAPTTPIRLSRNDDDNDDIKLWAYPIKGYLDVTAFKKSNEKLPSNEDSFRLYFENDEVVYKPVFSDPFVNHMFTGGMFRRPEEGNPVPVLDLEPLADYLVKVVEALKLAKPTTKIPDRLLPPYYISFNEPSPFGNTKVLVGDCRTEPSMTWVLWRHLTRVRLEGVRYPIEYALEECRQLCLEIEGGEREVFAPCDQNDEDPVDNLDINWLIGSVGRAEAHAIMKCKENFDRMPKVSFVKVLQMKRICNSWSTAQVFASMG